MTDEQRRYMHARNGFKRFHVDKAQELLDATAALVSAAVARATETEKVMDELREGVRICLRAETERQKKLKPGSPASTYTSERIAKLEKLI